MHDKVVILINLFSSSMKQSVMMQISQV